MPMVTESQHEAPARCRSGGPRALARLLLASVALLLLFLGIALQTAEFQASLGKHGAFAISRFHSDHRASWLTIRPPGEKAFHYICLPLGRRTYILVYR